MAPTPTGTASCMYLPRLRTVRTASAKLQRPRGNMRGIFAQAVSGDKVGPEPSFFEHAPGCDRRRQNRRLRDLGQPKLVFGTFEADLRKLVAQRVVGFGKRLFRDRVCAPPVPCPCHGLRSLAGKEKCDVLS